jgi:cell division protein FtsW (lipid II flippase)
VERRSRLSASQTRYANGTARRHKPDYWILILGSLLITIGLVVVYSISPGLSASQHISQSYFVIKQLIDVALGIVTFLFAAYKIFQNLGHPCTCGVTNCDGHPS